MRMTAAILLLGCLTASATGIGQTVSLQLKDAPVKQALKEIIRQGKVTILYNEKDLEDTRPVTITLHQVSVEEALQQVLDNQPLQFSIKGKTISIVVKPGADVQGIVNAPVVPPVIDVRGRVVNENGEPVLASVVVKGTKVGTTTNADGYFELKGVEVDATLVITAANIEKLEIKINGRSDLGEVGVKVKVESLGEVVINKGYYTEKQKYSVSNVGKVTAKDIEKQPVNNPLLALQGRVAGLVVTQNTGLPGGGVTVRIQGQNSLGSNNDPFYVIDGVPFISQTLPTSRGSILGRSGGFVINGVRQSGTGNPLSFINANDIESIEVLKDADATAIYGSRAANGAILITTKKGKSGQTRIMANMQMGVGKVPNKVDLLNSEQYLEMRREAFKNDGVAPSLSNGDYDLTFWDTIRYTDWQKVLIGGNAKFADINASVSGGSNLIQYLIGATYHKETSVFPVDFSDQKGSFHFNINAGSANQKFRIQVSANYLADNNQLPQTDLTSFALSYAPNGPRLFDKSGNLNWELLPSGASSWSNPLSRAINDVYSNKSTNLLANGVLEYKLLSGLKIRSSFGYNNLQINEFFASPLISNRPESRATSTRFAGYTESKISSWIIEPQLNYTKQFHQGNLDLIIGTTFQEERSDGIDLQGSGYNSDQVLKDIRSAATVSVLNSAGSLYHYNALFGRANYQWKEKYLINLITRRDGSSRFGANNQFHNFWSVGVGWIFSSESFIENSIGFLSFGKLRGSYGTTGNDQIGNYRFLDLYSPVGLGVPYQHTTSLAPSGLANPYLEWEETKKLQAGLDLGFLNNRILLSCTYVKNRSSNQLIGYSLPIMIGFSSIAKNFPATVQNTSLEFSITTANIKSSNFNWDTRINFTKPQNKLLNFPDLATSTYASSLIIGKSINIVKAYQFLGVNPQNGLHVVADKNGNPTTSPDFSNDRVVLINPDIRFYGGVENIIDFKKVQLDFLLQFSKQRAPSYFTSIPIYGYFNGGFSNQPVGVMKRWTKANDIASSQRFSQNFNTLTSGSSYTGSDEIYIDASYIRLKNVSLSWDLPTKWISRARLHNGRIFLHAQNLLTITKYDGLDPENKSAESVPPLRIITFGIQATL